MNRHLFWTGVIAVSAAAPALAAPPSANPLIETVTVTASSADGAALASTQNSSIAVPDSAALAARLPGAALVSNGGLSGQIEHRGMFGLRVPVRIDGQSFDGGGPNAMDPPLHYAPMPLIQSIAMDRGVSPVREGPGLGASFDAKLKRIDFGDTDDFASHTDVTGQYGSNNDRWSVGGVAGAANDRYRFDLLGSHEQGGDTEFPGGTIRDSAYARDVYGISAGARVGADELSLELRRQETGPTGNPPLPMDILFFHSSFMQAGFKGPIEDGLAIDAAIGYANIHHAMDNYSLRPAPAMASMERRNNARSNTLSGHARFTLGTPSRHFGFGADFETTGRNALIVSPNNALFYVQSLPDIAKDRAGAYLEWRTGFGPVEAELGARLDHHEISAAAPRIGPALPMGAQMLAHAFTAADRSWSANTVDVVASFWSVQGDFTPRLTLARKTRAPSAVERFAWLPTQMSGGLADGHVYVGDTRLKPETAWIAEAGIDWRDGDSFVRPTIYYRRIDDFIQGVPYDSTPGVIDSMVEMVAAMNGDPTPLRFANVGAEFYGADLDFGTSWGEHLRFDGTLSYVRAKRTDIHDNLYRIAPPHMRLGVSWMDDVWSVTLEGVGYTAQHEVSQTNNEQPSGGYAIANLFGQWAIKDGVTLTAGINNLFDRRYAPHLAGYNRVTNSDVPLGARLPAPGRSAFLRLHLAI